MNKNKIALMLFGLMIAAPLDVRGETPPKRNGFTLELAVGIGGIEIFGMPGRTGALVDVGFEPHAISLGGFLSERLALMYRWKSAYYFADSASGKKAQGVFGTHGVHLQYWINDRFFVAGGPAVGFFGIVLGHSTGDPPIKAGFAMVARGGWSFLNFENHSFNLSAEVLSGFFAGRTVFGQTVNLGYQWF